MVGCGGSIEVVVDGFWTLLVLFVDGDVVVDVDWPASDFGPL